MKVNSLSHSKVGEEISLDKAIEERVLTLTVNVPNGSQEKIEIRESDDIEAIANTFCHKHDLDANSKEMLLENIRALFDDRRGRKRMNQCATERSVRKINFEELDKFTTPRTSKKVAFDRLHSLERKAPAHEKLHQYVNVKRNGERAGMKDGVPVRATPRCFVLYQREFAKQKKSVEAEGGVVPWKPKISFDPRKLVPKRKNARSTKTRYMRTSAQAGGKWEARRKATQRGACWRVRSSPSRADWGRTPNCGGSRRPAQAGSLRCTKTP